MTAPDSTFGAAFSASDLHYMRRALDLAHRAVGLSDPNPRVGCVIVRPDAPYLAADGDRVLGEGHTQAAGQAHAEAAALRHAAERGVSVRGATVYVTLEPCSHQGRTPPCADALVAAGVARVVIAIGDPNPLVAGQGIARLRAAGIQVSIGLLAGEARELNIGFFSRMIRALPWVRLKIAASMDGRTALNNGASQWITGPDARADGHAWRKRAGALLTGVGTVRDDDPRLDVRLVATERQPLRVILDSKLQTPPAARLLAAPGLALIYAARPDAARQAALAERNVEVAMHANAQGKVDLLAVLKDLAVRGVNELHVEAGSKLNGSFIAEGLVDEFLIYLAPMLLGVGREMASFGPLERLQDGVSLQYESVDRIGADLRILARPTGRAIF